MLRKILTLVTILSSVVLVNGCSKCSRDPEPPVPATQPAAAGPEEMNGNPGVAQPGANDPGATDPNAAPMPAEDDVD